MGDVAEDKRILDYDQMYAMVNAYFDDIGRSRANPYTLLTYTGIPSFRRNGIINDLAEHGMREKFWLLRETFRFATKEYMDVSFNLNTTTDEKLYHFLTRNVQHFVHLSKDEPLYIAYTPDETYGKRDRRVKTTVGRYLKKHYGSELSDAEIRLLTDAFRYHFGVEDVCYAVTEEEIIKVYTTGPHSCMAYEWTANSERYGSQIHPSAVYATAGLKVAYMKREGAINARALVYDNPDNPEDRRWVRHYGDEILIRKLEQLGYKPGNLYNVKLRKIPAVTADGRELPDTYVCPYIDDLGHVSPRAQRIKVNDDHLLVVSTDAKGVFVATNTAGLVGRNYQYVRSVNSEYHIINRDGTTEPSLRELANSVTCSCCGKRMIKEGRSSKLHSHEHLCASCASDKFFFAYTSSGKRDHVLKEQCIVVAGTCYLNDAATLTLHSIIKLDEEMYGPNAYAERTATMEFDGKCVCRDDLVALSTGGVELRMKVVKTTRKINIGRAAPETNVRVDTGNGWLRTAEGDWPMLDDWITEVCVHHLPSEREAIIRNTLKGESPEIATRVVSWIPTILERNGMPELINEAKQISLLVEED